MSFNDVMDAFEEKDRRPRRGAMEPVMARKYYDIEDVLAEVERLESRVAALTAENEANYAAFRLEHECRNSERAALTAALAKERALRPWLAHGVFCKITDTLCDCGLTAALGAAGGANG